MIKYRTPYFFNSIAPDGSQRVFSGEFLNFKSAVNWYFDANGGQFFLNRGVKLRLYQFDELRDVIRDSGVVSWENPYSYECRDKAFWMLIEKGYSIVEIAVISGNNYNSVNSAIQRYKKKYINKLKDYE